MPSESESSKKRKLRYEERKDAVDATRKRRRIDESSEAGDVEIEQAVSSAGTDASETGEMDTSTLSVESESSRKRRLRYEKRKSAVGATMKRRRIDESSEAGDVEIETSSPPASAETTAEHGETDGLVPPSSEAVVLESVEPVLTSPPASAETTAEHGETDGLVPPSNEAVVLESVEPVITSPLASAETTAEHGETDGLVPPSSEAVVLESVEPVLTSPPASAETTADTNAGDGETSSPGPMAGVAGVNDGNGESDEEHVLLGKALIIAYRAAENMHYVKSIEVVEIRDKCCISAPGPPCDVIFVKPVGDTPSLLAYAYLHHEGGLLDVSGNRPVLGRAPNIILAGDEGTYLWGKTGSVVFMATNSKLTPPLPNAARGSTKLHRWLKRVDAKGS